MPQAELELASICSLQHRFRLMYHVTDIWSGVGITVQAELDQQPQFLRVLISGRPPQLVATAQYNAHERKLLKCSAT